MVHPLVFLGVVSVFLFIFLFSLLRVVDTFGAVADGCGWSRAAQNRVAWSTLGVFWGIAIGALSALVWYGSHSHGG